MSGKTPAEKMRLKPGMSAALLHAPGRLEAARGVPDGVIHVDSTERADFILDFATSQVEAEERLAALGPSISSATVAWLADPKGSKAAGLDLGRNTLAACAPKFGLILVANIAVDATWSAVRMRPLGT